MFRLRADPSSPIPTAITPKEKVYISGLSGALTGLSVGLVLSEQHDMSRVSPASNNTFKEGDQMQFPAP